MGMEKTGDFQTHVFRDEEGFIHMRLPGNPEVKPYDGRFGHIPESVNSIVFPEEG